MTKKPLPTIRFAACTDMARLSSRPSPVALLAEASLCTGLPEGWLFSRGFFAGRSVGKKRPGRESLYGRGGMLTMKINGIDGMTVGEPGAELQRGGKFVVF